MWLALRALLSCADAPSATPDPHECIDPNVREWCTDDAVGSTPPCGIPAGDPAVRCGRYDVVVTGDVLDGARHFLDPESGAHVAAVFFGDVHDDCPDDAMWYGQRIECEDTCSYVLDTVLPTCD
jgi:hypothetical protein